MIKNQTLKQIDTFQTTQKQQHDHQSTLDKSILKAKYVIKNISAMHGSQAWLKSVINQYQLRMLLAMLWSILYVSIFSYRLWQSTGQPDHRWAPVSPPNQGTLPIQQRARNRHQHCQLQQESNLLQNQGRGSASRIYRREKVLPWTGISSLQFRDIQS